MTRRIVFSALFLLQFLFQQAIHAQSADTLRIMSYNIHHANPPSKEKLIDLDAIAKVIIDANVDVVALQEVDVNTVRSGQADEAKLLAEKTGMHYRFFKAIDHDGGDYGLAILSKFPLKKVKLEKLPQQVVAEKRILAYATIKINGQKFIFANTHLDASKAHENRNAQMQHIMQLFSKTKTPVIFCGDFNSVAGSDAINELDKHFTRTCVNDCPGTVPVVNPKRTIDFIATKNITWPLVSYNVILETYASDHRPIVSTFKIR